MDILNKLLFIIFYKENCLSVLLAKFFKNTIYYFRSNLIPLNNKIVFISQVCLGIILIAS